MKKLALIFTVFSCILCGCTSDEKLPVKSNVQFGIAISTASSTGGRIASVDLPEGAYVSLSIQTATGSSVYSFRKTELLALGDGYITVPIPLIEGSYQLTDFMVMSKENTILYVTPKEGSDLAELVDDPLPANFSVSRNEIRNLSVQVVNTHAQIPRAFGYASFDIDVMESYFSVALFTIENNKPVFSPGKLTLYHNNQLVYTQDLKYAVSPVNFKGDLNERYVMFIQRDGYSIRSKEFVLGALALELSGEPLSFILEPALTVTTVHHATFDNNLPFSYNIGYNGVPNTPYKLIVDWGDGTTENLEGTINESGFASLFVLHFYADSLVGRPSYMNITGDLNNITFFFYVNIIPLSVRTMDVRQLTKLQSFAWIVVGAKEDTPSEMDFSNNPVLQSVDIDNTNLNYLDVSSNPILYRLGIAGTNINDVNAIVSDLDNHATQNNLVNGIFEFNSLQSLTPESLTKLVDLRNRGWQISPNP